MKKTLTLLLVLMFSMFVHAQGHLKFSGIEITGPKTEFVKKLQQKGYKLVRYVSDGAIMTGSFAGYSATINILCNSNSKVTAVVAELVQTTDWSKLMTEYEYYKALYTNKYGEPYKSIENNKDSYTRDNFWMMKALCEGGCTWGSLYVTDNGEIEIDVVGKKIKRKYEADINKGNIKIIYRDNANWSTEINKYQDDI